MTVEGQWTSVRIDGHECDLFEPATDKPAPGVILYLHGVHLNRLSDQPAFGKEFDAWRVPVISPITQRSWWTDRICPEFDRRFSAERYLLDTILPFIATRWGVHPPRIGLLGTSMGGQGALRLAYRYPHLFPVCAAISPAIDYHQRMEEFTEDEPLWQMYDDPEQARQDTALLHVHALNWPKHQFFCCDPTDGRWFDSADRLRMKLAAIGIPFECDLESTGGGHGFAYYDRMAPDAIRFLMHRLQSVG